MRGGERQRQGETAPRDTGCFFVQHSGCGVWALRFAAEFAGFGVAESRMQGSGVGRRVPNLQKN